MPKTCWGRVYEYFLSRFASAEGKRGGEFYTPRCVVNSWWKCWNPTVAAYTTLLRVSRYVRAVPGIRRCTLQRKRNGGRAKDAISIYPQSTEDMSVAVC